MFKVGDKVKVVDCYNSNPSDEMPKYIGETGTLSVISGIYYNIVFDNPIMQQMQDMEMFKEYDCYYSAAWNWSPDDLIKVGDLYV